MQHEDSVARSFGTRAEAYLTSEVHSQGADLKRLAEHVAAGVAGASVLDLGCGAGHASFAVAPVAGEVVAYDLTEAMLRVVASAARDRGSKNISTRQGSAESLPFASGQFDWVISRYSAHHWKDVAQALKEATRVLKPGGRACFIDVAGAPSPLLDTHLQTFELLRDPSHVRNYSIREWLALFEDAGFHARINSAWRLPIEFSSWVTRIGTPPDRIAALHSFWSAAPEEVRAYFSLQEDLSFELDALMLEAWKDEIE